MSNNKKSISLLVFNNFKNDSRVLKESMSLSNAGFEIEVIAHNDKGFEKEEIVEGITVKRVSYLDRKKATTLDKAIAYFKYIVAALRETKNVDFIHCNDLNTLPIGYIAKKILRRKTKIVYDAHEYETELDNVTGFPKKISKIAERILIKSADRVITVSDSIAKEYKRLYPKIELPELILNCPPKTNIQNRDIFRKTFNLAEDTTIFLFQGNLCQGRGIETTIDAFRLSPNKRNVIVIMGYGVLEDEIKRIADTESNVFFHEAVPQLELLKYTSSADFGILFYENSCLNHYYCSPNKMFEYIMAEIPVIISDLYEMKKIINKYKVGLIAEDTSAEGFLKTIEEANQLDRQEIKSNLLIAKELFNWEIQEKKLIELYKTL
jgi:glycosyltransferase involved in cell wall biosynthesis